MIRNQPLRLAAVAILSLSLVTWASSALAAETVKIQGAIKARSGPTVIVQTADSAEVVVLLTDRTEVGGSRGYSRLGGRKCRWPR